MSGPKRRVWIKLAWFATTAVAGGGCDLSTKAWAEATLTELPGQSLALASWLELSLAYNRGTAFSFVTDLGAARWVLGVLAIALVFGLLALALRPDADRTDRIAFGAIAGGAFGNGVDRVFHVVPGGGTAVVDFLKVNFPWGGSWPAFNVADALIAVGVGAILLKRLWTKPPPDPTPEPIG